MLLFLGLLTFDANDPSFNLVKSDGEVHNKAGLFGSYASGFLNDVFGVCALMWPIIFAAMGAAYVSAKFSFHWWRWCGFFLLTLCALVGAASIDLTIGDLAGGGMVGNTLYLNSRRYLSPFGSFLVWFFVFMVGLQLVFNFSWMSLLSRLRVWAKATIKLPTLKGNASQEAKSQKQSNPMANIRAIPQKIAQLLCKLPKPAKIFELLHSLPRIQTKKQVPPLADPGPMPIETPMEAAKEVARPVPSSKTQPPVQSEDDDFFAMSENPLPATAPVSDPATEIESPGVDAPVASSPETEAPPRPDDEPHPEENKPFDPNLAPEPAVDAAVAVSAMPREKAPSIRLFNEPEVEIPLPPTTLLNPLEKTEAVSEDNLKARGQALMACFNDFDIHGELVRITPGPVVTMYEVRPAAGIRVNKIANLSDDLSLALKAVAVRIQAPIPGSDTVGIEIPNENRQTVNFRELVESRDFCESPGQLTMILGKDIAGRPYMADLAKMPHLLVAGATGAGKSVCLNSMLVSLLYRMRPKDMRLLLIDPKRIEMAVYADLPHLMHPVVTEMSDAKNALEWAVHEMERRFDTIRLLGARNVMAYNKKLASFKEEMQDGLSPEYAQLEPFPYLVIVIDELADLMMTAARDVEASIMRLAALARAAAIHMIVATQRPSVDVVTGLIKANFSGRISFQVTSKHDSRTILDQGGAEHLLGRGDMLFRHSGGRLQRLHGPYLSDEEVQSVVEYWKSYQRPSYEIDFSEWSADNETAPAGGASNATSDALYNSARDFVLSQGRISISLLQRHLQIGFNRAARLIKQFEDDGLIGPADGSKPRNVIR